MTDTFGLRLDELMRLATRKGVGDDIDAPDVKIAIGAYADALGLSRTLVYDLSLSLRQIRRRS